MGCKWCSLLVLVKAASVVRASEQSGPRRSPTDASASALTITPGLAMHNKLPPPWKCDSFEQSFHHGGLSVNRANQRLVTAEFCSNGSGRQG